MTVLPKMPPRSAAVPAPIEEAEYRARYARIQESMQTARLDALLITSEDNYRYVTGFNSPTWVNLARPRYAVIPQEGAPCVIVPTTNVPVVRTTSWIADLRSWVSPNPADDGVSLAVEALKSAGSRFGRIGAELGPQSRLTMPVGDFLRLREALHPSEVVDGDGLLRQLRQIKSEGEVAFIRHAATIVSTAFARLAGQIAIGQTEDEACRLFQIELMRLGIERIPYLIGVSGFAGYNSLQTSPTQAVLDDGCVLAIDTGCSHGGYFCDFDRNYAFGRTPDKVRRIHRLLWQATEAGIRAARPGATAGDLWRAQAQVIGELAPSIGTDVRRAENGRMGHSIGLRLTEPPSVHPADTTVLVPGMVMTIEPAVTYAVDTPNGLVTRTMVHEENLVITGDGSALLSQRADEEITVVA
jgi:Xaa-Pro dipeptidase